MICSSLKRRFIRESFPSSGQILLTLGLLLRGYVGHFCSAHVVVGRNWPQTPSRFKPALVTLISPVVNLTRAFDTEHISLTRDLIMPDKIKERLNEIEQRIAVVGAEIKRLSREEPVPREKLSVLEAEFKSLWNRYRTLQGSKQ